MRPRGMGTERTVGEEGREVVGDTKGERRVVGILQKAVAGEQGVKCQVQEQQEVDVNQDHNHDADVEQQENC